MFINLSNHTSRNWSFAQMKAASYYGTIQDMPFPQIDPTSTSEEIDNLVNTYEDTIMALLDGDVIVGSSPKTGAVMLQGEFIFTYRLTLRLKRNGIRVVAARSKRDTIETRNEDGSTTKKVVFNFVDFMEY